MSPIRVCSFESRRAPEMRSLIERSGAIPTLVPSMREIPLADNRAALEFADQLLAGHIDVVIFLTGVGARILLQSVETKHDRAAFLKRLDGITTIVRGPKPFAVLREWNIHIDHRAPEPNTWRELVTMIENELDLAGRNVAVQEYGKSNEEFYLELDRLGAKVLRVPVYQWALPDDVEPLKQSVRDVISGKFDLLLFTSAQQIFNVLEVAESLGHRDEWIAAASKCAIGSIGPTASETLHEVGLPVDFEASPPKMGQLVRGAIESTSRILQKKQV